MAKKLGGVGDLNDEQKNLKPKQVTAAVEVDLGGDKPMPKPAMPKIISNRNVF